MDQTHIAQTQLQYVDKMLKKQSLVLEENWQDFLPRIFVFARSKDCIKECLRRSDPRTTNLDNQIDFRLFYEK